MNKQKAFNQSNKTYPMRLNKVAMQQATQKRLDNKQRTNQTNVTARHTKLRQLLKDEKFLKPNGKPNITAIAKTLKIKSRYTIYSDIKAIETKKTKVHI